MRKDCAFVRALLPKQKWGRGRYMESRLMCCGGTQKAGAPSGTRLANI